MVDRPDWTGTEIVPAAPTTPAVVEQAPAGLTRGDWGDGGYQPLERRETSTDLDIAAIEKLMKTDRRAYDRDHALQARYRDLLAQRSGEVATVDGIPPAALRVVASVRNELEQLGTWGDFEMAFDGLPAPAIDAIRSELIAPAEASVELFAAVAAHPETAELCSKFGMTSAAMARARIRAAAIETRMLQAGQGDALDRMLAWFDRVPANEQGTILRALAG